MLIFPYISNVLKLLYFINLPVFLIYLFIYLFIYLYLQTNNWYHVLHHLTLPFFIIFQTVSPMCYMYNLQGDCEGGEMVLMLMTAKSLTVLLILIFVFDKGYPLATGPICFNCQQVMDPTLCHEIKTCQENEVWRYNLYEWNWSTTTCSLNRDLYFRFVTYGKKWNLAILTIHLTAVGME
jgi:hypothetical protein